MISITCLSERHRGEGTCSYTLIDPGALFVQGDIISRRYVNRQQPLERNKKSRESLSRMGGSGGDRGRSPAANQGRRGMPELLKKLLHLCHKKDSRPLVFLTMGCALLNEPFEMGAPFLIPTTVKRWISRPGCSSLLSYSEARAWMARVMPRPVRINGCSLLTHSVKKRKDETVRILVSFRLIPNHGGGEMEDLSPPDHK